MILVYRIAGLGIYDFRILRLIDFERLVVSDFRDLMLIALLIIAVLGFEYRIYGCLDFRME